MNSEATIATARYCFCVEKGERVVCSGSDSGAQPEAPILAHELARSTVREGCESICEYDWLYGQRDIR